MKEIEKIEKEKKTRNDIINKVENILPQIEMVKKMEKTAKEVYKSLFDRSQSYRNNQKERETITNFLGESGNRGELEYYYKKIKEKLNENNKIFVATFQLFGNYIRYSTFFERNEDESYYSITNLLHHIIQYYRNVNTDEGKSTLIVIDALRNPYEISYLRKKYSSFYAMAISTNEGDRKNRLRDESEYNKATIKEFDETEYPSAKVSLREKFVYQNIGECTEMSDIHIVNNNVIKKGTTSVNKEQGIKDLKKQLVRYISLMKHPGLVIPTHKERTMQIAFMAKTNSGCISRQVGAVITDDNFAIKTIGWNTVPEGQVPCLLRDCYTLLETNEDTEELKELYSDFEIRQREKDEENPDDKTLCDCLKDKFGTNKTIFNGKNVSYCFKDVFNKQKGEKNQVHTRSLHAEENAFLQITKYGGQSIQGGKLFTTASPCELCAKKAYQLGIKEIYYIDLYPGISKEHILECGKNRPEMTLFEGAIGRAYVQLYQPIIPYKDEINDTLEHKK
jgi:dCMP deaminase